MSILEHLEKVHPSLLKRYIDVVIYSVKIT
jgi:hypothetical protein